MMTHEPCHGRVAREEQQHDRRVASLDLERARAAFVAVCQSAFAFLQVLHCFALLVLGVFSHFRRRFLACLPGTVGPPENTLVTRIINYIFIDT